MKRERKWIVKKKSSGRILGPYKTSEILTLLSSEDINEDDHISLYPGTDWHPISQTPCFFDHLISLLEKSLPKQSTQTSLDETVSPEDIRISKSLGENSSSKKDKEFEAKNKSSMKRLEKITDLSSLKQKPTIELRAKKHILKKSKFKKILLYSSFCLSFLALAFFVVIYGGNFQEAQNQVRLKKPQSLTNNKISKEDMRKLLSLSLLNFFSDTFTSYSKAQNHLIHIIENYKNHSQALGLLCINYLQLWPYSYQDTKDLETVGYAFQKAVRRVEPLDSGLCKTVYYLLQSRFDDARKETWKALTQLSKSEYKTDSQAWISQLSPSDYRVFFFYLRSLIHREKIFESEVSLNYATSAIRLLKEQKVSWLALQRLQARIYQSQGRLSEAAKVYEQNLKINPDHILSQIELGIIMSKKFKKKNQAYSLLSKASQSKLKIPSSLRSKVFLNLALIELDRQQKQKAIHFLKQSYKWDPLNKATKNLLVQMKGQEKLDITYVNVQRFIFTGDQYFREGDIESACSHYKSGYEIQPSSPIALKIGECLWRLGRSSETIYWLEKAIQKDPKFIEPYIKLADYYSQRYNFKIASKILFKAQTLSPESHEVQRGFCLLQYRTKNFELAVKFCEKAFKLYPNDEKNLILLAQSYLLNENYEKALNTSHKAILLSTTTVEAQLIYIKALKALQGVETAIKYTEKISLKFPQVIDYYLAISELLMEVERYKEASFLIKKAHDYQKNSKKVFLLQAKLEKLTNNRNMALETYGFIATLDPSDPLPFLEIGLIYLEASRSNLKNNQIESSKTNLKEAKKSFLIVIEINKLYPKINLYLAEILSLKNNFKNALEYLEKEKRLNPYLVDSYLLAADIYFKTKKYTFCAREYQQAISLAPQSSEIYIKVAICYRISGKIQIAVQMIEQAKKLDPGNFHIYKEMGAIYQVLGERRKAVEAYKAYLSLNPGAKEKNQINIYIRKLSSDY